VLVVAEEERGKEPALAALLRQLGADVVAIEPFGEVAPLVADGDIRPARAIVVDAGDRPDRAALVLRALRKEAFLAEAPSIIAVPARRVADVDPAGGFDDFIALPCEPAELYARIRALEWKKSEFSNEERLKIGELIIDRAAHEVTAHGRPVVLTAKEFALLAFLAANRGRVFSRETLLARVWGSRYEGGARTVDIHVRRLRAKLGEAFPLATLRGAGYKLYAPKERERER
jgi:DNA-binding response OmpR family regulator